MSHRVAHFRFFGSLNDFLPPERQQRLFGLSFQGDQSIKHLFESCGIPHVEVGQIVVNGQASTLQAIAQDGDEIEIQPLTLPIPLAPPARFVLDNHLGRLAASLRLLGIDSAYRNDIQDEELAQVSSLEGRILLTRDRRLLMRAIVSQGYCLRSLQPRQQILEILGRYDLSAQIQPFSRCSRCNELLQPVPKETVLEQLQPLTRRYFDEFSRCPGCSQVYWQGSHIERIQANITELIRAASHHP
jgi:uncharacterized protein with PIN domain